MNAIPNANNRIMVILIAVLIMVLLVLALAAVLWLWMMNGGMMRGGMMNMMTSAHGQMTDQLIKACTDMMQNLSN